MPAGVLRAVWLVLCEGGCDVFPDMVPASSVISMKIQFSYNKV